MTTHLKADFNQHATELTETFMNGNRTDATATLRDMSRPIDAALLAACIVEMLPESERASFVASLINRAIERSR